MADDTKNFLALMNGLARRNYYGQSEITDEFLKEEIYSNTSVEEFDQLLGRCKGLLKSLVSADMDMTQLEAFLTAQCKKKDVALTAEQANAVRKFWKIHKNKIHESIVSETNWGSTLQKVSWRIDLKSQARNKEHNNTPSAIMELQIANNQKKEKDMNRIRIEMDEEKLSSVLNTMHEIEEQISRFAQK